MPQFDISDMLLQNYTPTSQNLWKVTFPNIIGVQIPSFLVKSANRPAWDFDEHMIDYMTQKRKVAGKRTYQDWQCSLNEPIDTTVTQGIITWTSLIQQFETGLRGYVSMYKKDVTLELLDGVKNSVSKMILVGAWPKSTNLGTLDYSNADVITVEITFSFDGLRFIY